MSEFIVLHDHRDHIELVGTFDTRDAAVAHAIKLFKEIHPAAENAMDEGYQSEFYVLDQAVNNGASLAAFHEAKRRIGHCALMSNPGGDALNKSIATLADVWRVSNRYCASNACEVCNGIVRHEEWCCTQNAHTLYAFGCSVDPALMVEADHIILHGLGVQWNKQCERKCLA